MTRGSGAMQMQNLLLAMVRLSFLPSTRNGGYRKPGACVRVLVIHHEAAKACSGEKMNVYLM